MLRVREKCYARANRRVNDRKPLVMNSTPNLKKKFISVEIFKLVIQFTFNVPFELNIG